MFIIALQENQSYAAARDRLENEMQNILSQKTYAKDDSKTVNDQSTDKTILNKLIVNDIDENDIQSKINRAHSVLEAHRESIKTLLNTTVHAPSTLATRGSMLQQQAAADADGSNARAVSRTNTRRVVFVNLDEDS